MTPAIYQLRELVTEQDPARRMEALLEWERRWVKTLAVATFWDRLTMVLQHSKEEARAYMEEHALRQVGYEVAQVAERREEVWDARTERITHSVTVLTDRAPKESKP